MLVGYQESNIHSVDEKIRFEGRLQLLAWYYEYVQNVQPRWIQNNYIHFRIM